MTAQARGPCRGEFRVTTSQVKSFGTSPAGRNAQQTCALCRTCAQRLMRWCALLGGLLLWSAVEAPADARLLRAFQTAPAPTNETAANKTSANKSATNPTATSKTGVPDVDPKIREADATAAKSIEQALQEGHFNWYDKEKDGARRLAVRPPPEPWDFSWLTNWFTWSGSASPSGSGLSYIPDLFTTILYILLAMLIALVSYVISRWLKNMGVPVSTEVEAPAEDGRTRTERIEALPAPVRRNVGNFLDEARRLAEAGEYSEAMLYLYSHLLLTLDQHQVIRLEKGKTNRQYLQELLRLGFPGVASLTEPSVIAFEDVFFGGYPLERERFEGCWQSLHEIERQLPGRTP